MKACVLYGIQNIKIDNVPLPEPAPSEVVVEVKAAGICGSDIPRIYDTGAHKHPLILGHEFSGKVIQVGKNVENRWLHQRVGVFPLIPCKNCEACQHQQYEMCKNYDYLGSRRNGGFAQFVAVPEWNLIQLPDNVSFEQGAMLEPMAVAVHAIRKAAPKPEDTILILGLGTIGLLIVMFLLELGINHIYVVGNKEYQQQYIEKLGLSKSHFCNTKEVHVKDWIMDHTNLNGANIVFECVGSNDTIQQSLEMAANMGKVVFVGNPRSDILLQKMTYWNILRKQLTLVGTWNSSFWHQKNDDWHYVLSKLEQNKVKPDNLITHKLLLDDLLQGFELMKNKTQEYIKVMMISVNEDSK